MSNQKTKPSRWYYGLAALLPVLGCLITTAIIYRGFPNLPGALETIDVHNVTQVIVPGSADIPFPKKGAYAVYYEYRSLVDGLQSINEKIPPHLICSLTSKATGKEVGVSPEYIQGNTYSTKDRERVGVHILSISMTEPGIPTFFLPLHGQRNSIESCLGDWSQHCLGAFQHSRRTDLCDPGRLGCPARLRIYRFALLYRRGFLPQPVYNYIRS